MSCHVYPHEHGSRKGLQMLSSCNAPLFWPKMIGGVKCRQKTRNWRASMVFRPILRRGHREKEQMSDPVAQRRRPQVEPHHI